MTGAETGIAARVADATDNWVDTRAPLWTRPYLRLTRLDRPIADLRTDRGAIRSR